MSQLRSLHQHDTAPIGPTNRPNVFWALDFGYDQTSDGRNLKLMNVIDEYSEFGY
jgi:hypothetical protein